MRRECVWNTKESWTHIFIRRDRNDALHISTTISKVFVVGHSQGTFMSLAALTQPDIAELVDSAALFCRISYLEHITSKFALRMVNVYVDHVFLIFFKVYRMIGFSNRIDASVHLFR
ncbi:hypothetical protein ACFX1Q_031245 [Malus domestica]